MSPRCLLTSESSATGPPKYVATSSPIQHLTALTTVRIRCSRCYVVKGPNSYSGIYLRELKGRMQKKPGLNPELEKVVPCTKCTNNQVLELFCNGCK